MSLLLDHGHPFAAVYPVWMVSEESSLVIERMERSSANAAVLMQMAMATMPSGVVKPASTKSMRKQFSELIKKMMGDTHGKART